jgi:2-dehydro-3-deoxyphosphogluconate aldolase/(4S)-4-hydroxy-2-oxoglutarate aldolase
MPDMLLGIGTIKSLGQAQEYYAAGADFFISPGFVPEVAEYLIPKEVLYSPGCMTPTEIIAAEKAGVTFIKLFPGNVLGTGFMSAVKDVFPNLKFMPTGGVDTTKESIESWFKAGVSAVGMGSKLVSKELMQAKDYGTIEKETRKVMEMIRELR